ncbi:ABC transporter B family member 7, putative [Plasmodium gallinaceum]|uniref:ABC transporter B family member 7, putative n=1 Tax=Plasmodium gallinaceum TaxID=5849 RepID=A0A1J1GX87_PLAGA|nr:ABC transporter B family member 7, putative [Plasmodium gallinaceum]CRG95909.1 ABC transporter B family member 7, putative [Plasmodium gallinaceum]
MIINQYIVNHYFKIIPHNILSNNIKNISYHKNRNIIYITKNINYISLKKKKDFLFINKNVRYNTNNNNNTNFFKKENLSKIENTQNGFTKSIYRWKIRLFDGTNKNKLIKIKNIFKEKYEKKMGSNLDGISLKDVFKILKKERKYLALAFACLLISSLGQMVFPMCISKIINLYGGKEESLKYLMNEVYKTILLILGISTFSFFRIYLIETSIEKITRRLRKNLFEKIINQNLSFFDKQKTGELINRLSNDIEISSKILIHLSFGIRNFIAALIGGICALHISPSKLFNSFLLPVSACLLIGTSYGKYVKRISIKKQEKLSNCIDFASEKIYNIGYVRLLNGESFEKKEFTKYLNEVYKIGKKYSLVKAGNHFLFFSIISLFLLHLIYYGNYLIVSNLINTGDLFSLIMYSLFCGSGIQGIMHAIGDLQKCIGSCSKVLQIINLPDSEFNDYWLKNSINFLKRNNYSIKFENVSFSYDNNNNNEIEEKKNYALKNVSFYLPHNKSVAIVGKSGSGKTTILNLLSKKNIVNEGNIYFGDFNINKINSSALRSILSVITQDPFLFNISVKSNLLYPHKAHHEMLKEQVELIKKKDIFINENLNEQNNNLHGITNDVKEIYAYLLKEIQKTQENINNITTDKLRNIYKDLHIHDFLNNYSNYDNINVGVSGSFLSGGQKQRVYIAQNLLKNNKILILDEPTSSLDKLSENIINEALYKYMKGKTTIIFTHRLALLKFVDYIGVLNDGIMIQFDLRNKVLQNPCDILKQILNQNI